MATVKESERDDLKLKANQVTSQQNLDQPQIINNQIGLNENTTNAANPQINVNPVPIQASPAMPLVVNAGIEGFVPIIKPKQFGSKPVGTYCPNCRFPVTTISTRKCNCCSCYWCWSCFYLWILIQCCRGKEMTCCDYEHTCPRCGFVIGNYDAW